MLFTFTIRRRSEAGFSLLEMMLATVILLVGLVAIAQLVPATILLNFRNRTDSSALVFAQRELDQFLDQPLFLTSFTDAIGNTCALGNATPVNTVQGSSLAVISNQVVIDFTQTLVPNYSFAIPYQDPSDPSGTSYDVRWAVIVTGNGSTVSSKRFILGIRQQGGNGYFQPITLDTTVEK
jgi:prepilin-type N-terminal cleavage/methylation domain-containing protein